MAAKAQTDAQSAYEAPQSGSCTARSSQSLWVGRHKSAETGTMIGNGTSEGRCDLERNSGRVKEPGPVGRQQRPSAGQIMS